jgi:hypothetical protein
MITWLKLVAAIIAAEAVEHAAEAFFLHIRAWYTHRKRKKADKAYYSR